MLFYIVKGTIRLFLDELKGNRKIIFLTEPGNFVFEANFFHSSDINATAEALTDVELAVFPKEKVFFLLEKEQDFRMALINYGIIGKSFGVWRRNG